MRPWEARGRRFQVVASDVIRDGMALELTDLYRPPAEEPVLEIFWSDADSTMTFTAHRAVDVPMEILTRFVEAAQQGLPPRN